MLGDNTSINIAAASLAAPLLRYTPVHTTQVIEQLKGQTVDQLIQAEGESMLGEMSYCCPLIIV